MAATGQMVPMNNTLFGCMDDCGDCVHAWCLPQCHLGSIAQNANSGDCFGTSFVGYMLPPLGCYQCYAKSILEKALQRVGVTQPIAFFEWYCCTACLQCQVSREVNAPSRRRARMFHRRDAHTRVIIMPCNNHTSTYHSSA